MIQLPVARVLSDGWACAFLTMWCGWVGDLRWATHYLHAHLQDSIHNTIAVVYLLIVVYLVHKVAVGLVNLL